MLSGGAQVRALNSGDFGWLQIVKSIFLKIHLQLGCVALSLFYVKTDVKLCGVFRYLT